MAMAVPPAAVVTGAPPAMAGAPPVPAGAHPVPAGAPPVMAGAPSPPAVRDSPPPPVVGAALSVGMVLLPCSLPAMSAPQHIFPLALSVFLSVLHFSPLLCCSVFP